jgi:RNA polymerase sigma-70 factor, ECF subfamily
MRADPVDVTPGGDERVDGGMQRGDEELVQRVLRGETRDFAELVGRHHPRLLRYATRMLGDPGDAEEVVQDAFVRAHRSLNRYQDRDRFGAWIFRILVNACRARHAILRRRERTFVPYSDALEGSEEPRFYEPFSRRVQQALAELPAELREAVLLKYVEELSYEEMSAVSGVGVSALKMRVMRAREQMRLHLEGATVCA